MRRSYAYVYALLISSEPVSEALLPIYNQLQTLRRCLVEVEESGGVSTSRELYPYSMKVGILQNQYESSVYKYFLGSSIPLMTCESTASSTWATISPKVKVESMN